MEHRSGRPARGWTARGLIGLLAVAVVTVGLAALARVPAAHADGPFTIWPATAVPGTLAANDPSPVTVGVKFRSDVAGFVTGVRFYKGAGNGGTHVGDLWATDGTHLASVTFQNETATGWQQANFASPVAINANTIYIVSYLAPQGHYAYDANYFGSSGVDNGVLHATEDTPGPDGPNGVFGRGTTSVFPDQFWMASNYWVDVVFQTSAPVDTTPPTVVATNPANNATNVAPTVAPSATFSEGVQSGTISFALSGPGGPVAGTVGYNPANSTATFTPSAALQTGATYTATVSGAKDAAGNTMTAPATWSFQTVGDGVMSLWPSTTVPGTPASDDTSAVTVGVKFQSDVAGFVTGVRFYKGAGNGGTHVGDLWATDGTHLASVTFQNETATGWQQATFSAAVPIQANTVYIVSYLDPQGHYSYDVNYFANRFDSGVLHAPSNSTTPNGVYGRGTSSVFPDQTWLASNYWVDVTFQTTPPVDTTPPTVASTNPVNNATNVSSNVTPSATFSEAVQPATVTFGLSGPGGAVAGTLGYNATTNTSTFTPSAPLTAGAVYTATVSGAKDAAGNTMAAPATWTFTIATSGGGGGGGGGGPLDQGPGGPVLVVTDGSNPFSVYYAEILRNEGYNEFATAALANVTATTLASYDAVILGDEPLTAAQVTMFTTWVNGGGNLIAMHPDAKLASLLGLTSAGSTLSNAYLKVNTASGPGVGITDQTIQFHGTADRYSLNGATAVATLYSDANSATTAPAVTIRSVGSSGGQAAAFTYDLARSVVYTRQGNPAWAGQARDGDPIIRSDDQFFGGSSPDWVNLDKVQIPQADEQQRLLGNLLTQMTLDKKPLPHFWYLPNGKKAAVIMTGDDHVHGGTVGRFDQLLAESTPGCSVANWECLRMSSYIMPGTQISDAQAAAYTAQGFEIGTHVSASGNTVCSNFTPSSLASTFSTLVGFVHDQLPSIPAGVSERLHCVTWSDWATVPKVEAANGVRLDGTYYYWPESWIQDRPGMFTGSGMPMRFADTDGSMIDVYQATTQMTDESGQTYPKNPNTLFDNAIGPLGYYGVFNVNAHTDDADSPQGDAVIASAQARGIPVVSGRQMVTWLDGRNTSAFGSATWNGSTLGFTVTQGSGANGLQALLPAQSASGGTLTSLTRGGSAVPFTVETVKGIQYARFAAAGGSYSATYGTGTPPPPDTTPPAISSVTPTPTATGATITWTTDEPSTSRVDYGTAAGSLTQNATTPGLTTTHSVTVSGLTAATNYFFRVTSADAAGNSATSPDPAGAPATFTTTSAQNTTVTDTTAANFTAGTVGTGSYVAQTGDGEVSLAPAAGSEFSGTALPSGWTKTNVLLLGTATVAGGSVAVDGAYVRTSSTFSAGRSLEFVGTFDSSASNQSVGLGSTLNQAPWLMFSTRTGGALWASTRAPNGTQTNTSLGTASLGAAHRFRIDWTTTSVVYSVDGVVVATHPVAITTAQRMVIRDNTTGGAEVSVDWMRLSPYASSGTFTSRVFDGGTSVHWNQASWNAAIPAGTTLTVSVRTGNTATPDGTWSAFAPVASSGAALDADARYAQYRLALGQTSPAATPSVSDVSLRYAS
jgi:hypothetical protein